MSSNQHFLVDLVTEGVCYGKPVQFMELQLTDAWFSITSMSVTSNFQMQEKLIARKYCYNKYFKKTFLRAFIAHDKCLKIYMIIYVTYSCLKSNIVSIYLRPFVSSSANVRKTGSDCVNLTMEVYAAAVFAISYVASFCCLLFCFI